MSCLCLKPTLVSLKFSFFLITRSDGCSFCIALQHLDFYMGLDTVFFGSFNPFLHFLTFYFHKKDFTAHRHFVKIKLQP